MFSSTPRSSSSNESFGRGRGRGGSSGQRRTMRESTREKKPIPIHPYECPLDPIGHPVSVPMRFEVIKLDGTNVQDEEELKEFFLGCLRVSARDCGVEVDELGEIRMNPMDKMKQTRWVCHFKVSCSNWQSSLAHFTRVFHYLIKNDRLWDILRHEIPIVYTHSQLIYPLRLINVHKDVAFKRIKFGSLINSGTIGIHWNIEGGFATESDKEDGFTFYKDIDASFEYDRKQITIFFHNRECHPEDRTGEIFLATYKVTINTSSIRKIGVDAITSNDEIHCDDYGYDRTPRTHYQRSLILTVDYPPKIQVKLKNKIVASPGRYTPHSQSNGFDRRRQSSNGYSPNNQNREFGNYEHRLEIHRGRYPGEISNIKALHESKLIILEFDEDYIKGKLTPSNSTLDQLCFDIVSRLRHKTGKAVEYTSFDQVQMLEGSIRNYYNEYDYELIKVHPYEVESDFDHDVMKLIKNASIELVTRTNVRSVPDMIERIHHINLKAFRLHALLEGILQRGMEIRCQLLVNRAHWYSFVDMICRKYASNEQQTLLVLENLLSTISEGRPHCSVWHLFDKEWEDTLLTYRRSTVFTEEDRRKGFTRVMKFVITPTRLFFVGYETIMANRVLNQNSRNGTEIVRVSFRDDSGEYMRDMSCGTVIFDRTMRRVLMDDGGFYFAGRKYKWLGNSNSQLRDRGYYAYHETERKTAREIRGKLGNFQNLTSIPKWLARQGQCFTQARASGNNLPINEVGVTYDFIGGMTDKRKPYVFSDGVGTISFSLAYNLSTEHSLPRTASAFQIRHKGQKGLVAVDPNIDKRNELLEMMHKREDRKEVFVRPSMDKFEVEETSRSGQASTTNLEIVKYSMPSPLFLNRPLLNILSQVSEDQSSECHRRMSNRIEDLLDIQLRNTVQSLYVEHRARETIKEMSFPFAMEVFSDANPMKMTSEPFFRSLLRANSKFVLHKQLAKMQIRIPSDFGRSMFGVVDTTGILQYGQIFCQYSPSTSKHLSTRSKKRDVADGAIILKGSVMMTKNPCIEKGDVRLFEAIDVPGLRHLVDVVVFPMHGPRPHPDEMAGSDLDGDEYSLIWDSQLLFDHNEEASLFPSGEDVVKWPIVLGWDGRPDIPACERRLADFYIEAVGQEQIGVLSNAHLATSDFYGLENKASRSLARKISQSLDFQKNGVHPEEMTTVKDVQEDPDDENRVIPPEKAVRKPDYMEKMRDAGYESRGIMGKIFREIKRYQHAIDAGEDQIDMIEKDPAFNLPGWDIYEDSVTTELENFSHGIISIMEHYGITSEGELMSGQILSIKNRISEKEADDMNLFNTNMVIEDKVKREISAARVAFFAPLLNWEDELDQVDNRRRDVEKDSILCRIVRSSTNNIDKIRLKAAACYNVCYDAANRQLENGDESSLILSFPWIFYDVLADIKLRPDDRIVRVLPEEVKEQSNEPLALVLSTFIDDYCENEENEESFSEFKSQFEGGSMIGRFVDENEGLARASFVLVQWAKHVGGMNTDSKFNQRHLVALFIQFGLGEVMVRGTRRRYIQRPSGETRVHLKKGEHLLRFIDFLASREFRSREVLSFNDIMEGALMRGEWRTFSELMIPAYLGLVTTHRIDLPLMEEADTRALRSAAIIKEFEPRKMELPESVVKNKLDEVRRDLMRITRCKDIQLRPFGSSTEVFVSAIGTTENFKVLNDLVVSPSPNRNKAALKTFYYGIPKLVYERLVRTASEAPPLPLP